MKLKRSVLAVGTALAIAAGATPATAADLTPAQVAGETAVGTVKPLDSQPKAVTTGEPQSWLEYVDGNTIKAYSVYSPSMDREVPVGVIPARDAEGNLIEGAPTVYLLNGAGGAEQDSDWFKMTNKLEFYQNKGVNVVVPQGGAFTYYADWLKDDLNTPYLKGPQKWETFITKELPGPIEAELKADNRRAIVGFSMSATSALLMAEHNPGFYDSVGSFSGCAATSTPIPYQFLRLTVQRGSGTLNDFNMVTPEMMYGPMGGSYNRYNDALVNAEKLRGTELYISTATGLAAETDMVGYYTGQGAPYAVGSANALTLQVEGGAIEAAMNACTHDLRAKLKSLSIPAHYELRNAGTHSWPGWREDLEKSWNTTIKPSFDM
ncbi:alpha/beta hydrolase [Corynebacterium pilosum]|uniref:Trehalose corynomycolyl transferase A n=1 Tax=Corynebacterium pilosum TaxID=35756 RepID=A0A376CM29_9CORY|nr:alpha/beta hydrolase family protein [Corynebacterium pilosum]STC69500.1 trehalose corynomycolyl transferase A [Corynebacterium pilosum]